MIFRHNISLGRWSTFGVCDFWFGFGLMFMFAVLFGALLFPFLYPDLCFCFLVGIV